MNIMNFEFVFTFFLLQHKKIYSLKLIVSLTFSLLRHDSLDEKLLGKIVLMLFLWKCK